MSYIELHKKIGFKVGEKVRVTTTAESLEKGWNNQWVAAMNRFVGKEGIIINDYNDTGLEVKFDELGINYCFPAFVLELAKKRRSKKQIAQSMKNFTRGTLKGQIKLLHKIKSSHLENDFLSPEQLEQLNKSISSLINLQTLLQLS